MTTETKDRKATVRQAQEAAYEELLPTFISQAKALLSDTEKVSRLCDCGRRVAVEVPSIKGWLDLWKFYDERVAGKPANQAEAPRAVDMSRPLGEMSDEELTLLVAGAGAVA